MKLLPLILLFAALSSFGGDAAFTLESSTFKDGGPIPAKCAMKGVKGGENVSPALSWRNPPAGTKCYVITCIDKHPIAQSWVHWMLFEIPGDCHSLQEGASLSAMPNGCVERNNGFKLSGWGGPMPPPGSGAHQYLFTIYALDERIMQKGENVSEKQFMKPFNGNIIGSASITGTFER